VQQAAAGGGGGGTASGAPPFALPEGFAMQNEDPSLPREQHVFSDFKPSPAFAAAWARYKRMHVAYTSAFHATGAPPREAGQAGDGVMRGSIVVNPAGQLANRVMASVSAFLLGLLTDRAVYLSFAPGYYASLPDMFEDPGIPWDADAMPPAMRSAGGPAIHMAEPFPPAPYVEYMVCKDLAEALASGDSITIASNQYFVPLMAHNPVYAARLAELFPEGDIFGAFARELFRPSAAVVAMKEAFKRQVGWADRYVVALQVRTGGDFTDRAFGQADWDLLSACGELMLPAGVDRSRAAIFVATDIEWSRDAALTQLARTGLPVWEFGTFLRSNTPQGCQQAFVDILLLSEANDVVTTPWSTFGYFAVGLTRKRPVVLTQLMPLSPDAPLPTAHEEIAAKGQATFNGVGMHVDHRTGCARLPTAEPCFHFLPAFMVHELSCYDRMGNPWLEQEMRGGRYC
jgi:hypothetical protein